MDIASLGLKIDTGQVSAGVKELDKLTTAGGKAEASADAVGSAWKDAGTKVSGASQEIAKSGKSAASALGDLVGVTTSLGAGGARAVLDLSRATTSLGAASTRAATESTRSADAYLRTSTVARTAASAVTDLSKASTSLGAAATVNYRDLTTSLGATAFQAKAAEVAVTGVTAATAAVAPAAAKGAASFYGLAAGQKLTAYQSQQLSFQLNDLFVQIASGQSPLTALIQQGSQLNGTFGGFTGTFRALSTVFTVGRVAIGGLLSVLGSVGYAFITGRQESSKFAQVLALTGNAAGVTEDKFNELAKTISATTSTSIGSTRETLQALLASGRFSAESLGVAGAAAQNFAKVTGASNEDVLTSFVKLAGGVGKGAQELNNQYHFLTASQLDYINTLEDQGDSQKALQITFEALNARLEAASGKLGSLERAWIAVKNAASGAVDTMLQIGRVETPEAQIAGLEKRIANARKPFNPSAFDGNAEDRARLPILEKQLAAVKGVAAAGQQAAKASKEAADTEQAKTAFLALQEKTLSKAEIRVKEIAKANALADKSGASAADRAKVIANINEKHKDPKGVDTTRVDAKAQLQLQVEDIKSAGQALALAYANTGKLVEARRSAGLLEDKQFYAEKRTLIELTTQAQIDAIQKENDLLSKQKLNTKDGLDRDREVLKNLGEINKLRADGATQLQILAIQEESSGKRLAQYYRDAEAAAQSYLDTIRRAQSRELSGFGQGNQERDRTAGRAQIEDRFDQQRRDLEKSRRDAELNGTFGADAQAKYNDELDRIRRFQATALTEYDAFFAARLGKEKDFQLGASEALKNYYTDARNVYKQTEDAVTNAFKGMEDALVSFVTTGKLDFKSLAQSIIADIARIIIKQQISNALGVAGGAGGSGLGGLFGSLFSSGGGSSIGNMGASSLIPGFAKGGDPAVGKVAVVGERGPELFVPRTAGTIISNEALTGSSGGPVSVQVSVDASGTSVQGDGEKADQLGKRIGAAVRDVILQEKMPGGMLAGA